MPHKTLLSISIIVLLSLVYSCAYDPYKVTNRSYRKQAKALAKAIRSRPSTPDSIPAAPYWAGTTNFNLRKPNFVIIHHTAQHSCNETLRTFTLPRSQVSAHYVICKDGLTFHMLNDYLRAWHAGAGRWGNVSDINSSSIGIEIDNNGFEPFTENQLVSLLRLLDTLKSRYSIPAANFIGHADIAPTRKNDPNIYFPWKTLAEKGFGLWYADTTGNVLPENFEPLQALRLVGYDVRDSTAAIIAFKRHFVQDTMPLLFEGDKKILYNLSRQVR